MHWLSDSKLLEVPPSLEQGASEISSEPQDYYEDTTKDMVFDPAEQVWIDSEGRHAQFTIADADPMDSSATDRARLEQEMDDLAYCEDHTVFAESDSVLLEDDKASEITI